MPSSRRNGSADSAITMACGQPGRIGSGVTVRESSMLAPGALVADRSTVALPLTAVARYSQRCANRCPCAAAQFMHRPGGGLDNELFTEYPARFARLLSPLLDDFPDPGEISPVSVFKPPRTRDFSGHRPAIRLLSDL